MSFVYDANEVALDGQPRHVNIASVLSDHSGITDATYAVDDFVQVTESAALLKQNDEPLDDGGDDPDSVEITCPLREPSKRRFVDPYLNCPPPKSAKAQFGFHGKSLHHHPRQKSQDDVCLERMSRRFELSVARAGLPKAQRSSTNSSGANPRSTFAAKSKRQDEVGVRGHRRENSQSIPRPRCSSESSQGVRLLQITPRKEVLDEGCGEVGKASLVTHDSAPSKQGQGDGHQVTLLRVTPRKGSGHEDPFSKADAEAVPWKDELVPSKDGAASRKDEAVHGKESSTSAVTLLRISAFKEPVFVDNVAQAIPKELPPPRARASNSDEEESKAVTLLRVTPRKEGMPEKPAEGNHLFVFDEEKNQFGLNPETGALSKIDNPSACDASTSAHAAVSLSASSSPSVSQPAPAVPFRPPSVPTHPPAAESVAVDLDFPEWITEDRASEILECCFCNPCAWCAWVFIMKAESYRISSKLPILGKRYYSKAVYWGGLAVDCGFVAFAFNVVFFLLIFLALIILLLLRFGVSFIVFTRWGKGPDADVDMFRLGV